MEGESHTSTTDPVANTSVSASAVNELILDILGKCGCAGYAHCFQGVNKGDFRRLSVQEISNRIKISSLGSKEAHPDMLILIGVHSERIHQQMAKFTSIQNQNSLLPSLVNISSVTAPTKTSATAGGSGSDGSLGEVDNDNDFPIFVNAAPTPKKIEEIDLGMTSDDDDDDGDEVEEEPPSSIPVTESLPVPEPVPMDQQVSRGRPKRAAAMAAISKFRKKMCNGDFDNIAKFTNIQNQNSLLPSLVNTSSVSTPTEISATAGGSGSDGSLEELPERIPAIKPIDGDTPEESDFPNSVNPSDPPTKDTADKENGAKVPETEETDDASLLAPASMLPSSSKKSKFGHTISHMDHAKFNRDDTMDEKRFKYEQNMCRSSSAVHCFVNAIICNASEVLGREDREPTIENHLLLLMSTLNGFMNDDKNNLVHTLEGLAGRYGSSHDATKQNNALLRIISKVKPHWMVKQETVNDEFPEAKHGKYCFLCPEPKFYVGKNTFTEHISKVHGATIVMFMCPNPECDRLYKDRVSLRTHLRSHGKDEGGQYKEHIVEALSKTVETKPYPLAKDLLVPRLELAPRQGVPNLLEMSRISLEEAPEGFREFWHTRQSKAFPNPKVRYPKDKGPNEGGFGKRPEHEVKDARRKKPVKSGDQTHKVPSRKRSTSPIAKSGPKKPKQVKTVTSKTESFKKGVPIKDSDALKRLERYVEKPKNG